MSQPDPSKPADRSSETAEARRAAAQAERDRRSDRISEWYDQHWAEREHPCFICGADDWMFLDLVDVDIPPLPGEQRMVYSLLPVICRNCGHTVFANAIAARVLDPDRDDSDDESG